MLSAPAPFIRSILNSPEVESGTLLSIDLDEALDRYVRERASLVKRLKELSVEDWQRTAEHEAFSHYSVWIIFRHVLNHEMFHAYRIEELFAKEGLGIGRCYSRSQLNQSLDRSAGGETRLRRPVLCATPSQLRGYPACAKHSEAAPEWYRFSRTLTRECWPSHIFDSGFGWLITMEK